MFLVKRAYFNKTNIIKGLMVSLLLSAFIYLSYFEIEYKLLDTILALLAFYFLLTIDKKSLVYTGFFTGILWFYWVGNSLEYYDLNYLFLPTVLFFALLYALLFYFITLVDSIYFRFFMIVVLSYINPFGFNWFVPELAFINSYFSTDKLYFIIILISLIGFIKFKSFYKLLAIIPLIFIFENRGLYIDNPPLKIDMPQVNINQKNKWLKSNLSNVIETNLSYIQNSIDNKKDLIILPETAFPIYLNKEELLMEKLFEMSYSIDIITGAMYYENSQYYNASYHFSKGSLSIGKKVVLVPFGEKIPLPKFFVNLINDIFYGGASDYEEAKEPTNFNIRGISFRNAICYEATTNKIYENLNGTSYMVALSNNAWFTPSIEPTLQKLLLKYYAKRYNITIFHSINGSENYTIRP